MAAKRKPDIPQKNNGNKSRIKRAPVTRTPEQPREALRRSSSPKMNINEQTPSKRRALRETKRIDPDSPEIRRSAKKAQGYKIKKKKKGISRVFVAYAVLFVIVFAAVAGVISLAFYTNLTATEPSAYDGLRLKLCLEHEAKDLKAVVVDTEKYVIDGELYVNMTAISEKFGFIMTGDRKWLRFITNEKTGESVCFETGTPFAEINGTEVRLNSNVLNLDGSLFVPAEFFNEYVNGMEISFDEEENILSILRDTARNEAGHFDEAEIGFRLKPVEDSTSISEFELSEEIKGKCYFIPLTPAVSPQS